MQIIGGQASGIRLSVPKGLDVRPTGVRARKGLFDSVGTWTGMTVVDLFAGAGSLGLEAASRGAKQVFFVDNSRKHCSIISENIQKVQSSGVKADMQVLCCDVRHIHQKLSEIASSINLIFADPPYKNFSFFFKPLLTEPDFAIWAEKAVFIWEIPPSETIDFYAFSSEINLWKVEKHRKFAQTEFLFLKTADSK